MYEFIVLIIYLILAYLILKQLSIIRKFRKEKANKNNQAKPLASIGVSESVLFKNMKKKDVFVQTKENRYFMEEEKAKQFAKKRRGLFYTLTFLFLILFFFIMNNF